MISSTKNFIFIHIPKTGGNSIQNILSVHADDKIVCHHKHQDGVERFELHNKEYGLTKHSRLQDYINNIPKQLLDQYRIYTCIRNPWERMISYYFSPHRQATNWSRSNFLEMLKHEVKPSSFYISTKDSEVTAPDRLRFIRFENLHHDMTVMCKELGIELNQPLPHRNKSTHLDYRHYYDEELAFRVAQSSRLEIDRFGYEY